MSSPVSTAIGDHLWWYSSSPTQRGYPSVGIGARSIGDGFGLRWEETASSA